jgi:threonine/homoserine/homoserine lactone efflux protein
MPWLFLYAFMLGLVFNAAPGAILAESLRRGLKGGFAPAFAVQIGSLVGDGLWVILGLAGTAALMSISYISIPLMLSGTLLLGYLAWQSFRDSRMPMPDLHQHSATHQRRGALATQHHLLGFAWRNNCRGDQRNPDIQPLYGLHRRLHAVFGALVFHCIGTHCLY